MKKGILIFFLCLASLTWGQGITVNPSAIRIGTTTPPPEESDDHTGTYYLQSSSVPNGSYAANSLLSPHFTNAAGTRSGNNFSVSWDGEGKILGPLAQTTYSSRDGEATSHFVEAVMLFRVNGDAGFYAYYHSGVSNGLFAFGGANDIPNIKDNYAGQVNAGRLYEIYRQTNVNSLYTATGTDSFTVRVEGFDIIFSVNGQELIRKKQYVYMNAGSIGILPLHPDRSTFRGFTAKHLPRKTLYSNYTATLPELDMRDFDIRKDAYTTGSMSIEFPNTLYVADASKFRVGDSIIVAVGGEGEQYGRQAGKNGTEGVGGKKYPLTYPTVTALQADLSKPDDTRAVVLEDGKAYFYEAADEGWYAVPYDQLVGSQIWKANYHEGWQVPYPLYAMITAISGNEITLDKPCQRSTTNAPVWLDTHPLLQTFATGPNVGTRKIIIPSGKYVMYRRLDIQNKPGWVWSGKGKDSTIFLAPEGVGNPAIVLREFSHKGILEHMGFWGNYTDSSGPNTPTWGHGGLLVGNSDSVIVRHTYQRHFVTGLLGSEQSKNVYFYDNEALLTKDPNFYFAWAAGINDGSHDNIFRNLKIVTTGHRIGGAEAYGSRNLLVDSGTFVNAAASSNSGIGMRIENCHFTFNDGHLNAWQDRYNPLINMNGNNAYTSGSGGVIRNNTFIINGHGDSIVKANPTVIKVQEGIDSVSIINNTIVFNSAYYPGWGNGSAVIAHGQDIFIDSLYVTIPTGTYPGDNLYNNTVGIQDGKVLNSNLGAGGIYAGNLVEITNTTAGAGVIRYNQLKKPRLTLSYVGSLMTVDWPDIANATQYELQYTLEGSGVWTTVYTGLVSNFTYEVAPGNLHWFRIKATAPGYATWDWVYKNLFVP